jgi:hypothetical protein
MAKADHLPNLIHAPFPDESANTPTNPGQPAGNGSKQREGATSALAACAPSAAARRGQRRQLGHRRYFVGGSDARIIMGNDEVALLRLWREKRAEVEPEDLSANLLVQLGLVTEDLNRR